MADQDPHRDPDDEDEFDDSGIPLFDYLDQHEHMHPDCIELEKIPRRFWEQTLAPFHRSIRAGIAHRVADERLRALAFQVAVEIDHAAADARNARDEARYAARRTGYPLPMPHAGHAVAQPTKQVNIRLRADDHERVDRGCAVRRTATDDARAGARAQRRRADPAGTCGVGGPARGS
jgi:hypothetical protein